MLNKEVVKETWKEVFGEQLFGASKAALGDYYFFTGYLAKSRDDFAYGISHNDPLNYKFYIDEDGTYSEMSSSLSVETDNPHMYCESVKLRKQKIKNVDKIKLTKRFQKLKNMIEENKDRIKK